MLHVFDTMFLSCKWNFLLYLIIILFRNQLVDIPNQGQHLTDGEIRLYALDPYLLNGNGADNEIKYLLKYGKHACPQKKVRWCDLFK